MQRIKKFQLAIGLFLLGFVLLNLQLIYKTQYDNFIFDKTSRFTKASGSECDEQAEDLTANLRNYDCYGETNYARRAVKTVGAVTPYALMTAGLVVYVRRVRRTTASKKL